MIFYYSDKVLEVMKRNRIDIDPKTIAELPIAFHDGELYGLVRFTKKLSSLFDECICSWYK